MPAALQVIRNPQAAATALDPARLAILDRLKEPTSAAAVSRETGVPRQKLNYHFKLLEANGLVEFVEERRKGNCVERLVRATAKQYLISPEALGKLGTNSAEVRDRFSAAYLASAAGRAIRDLALVRSRADAAGKKIATLTLEANVKFASPETRNAFAEEFAESVARLVAKYHDESAPTGRNFRLLVGVYPKPPEDAEPGDTRAANME
ncbi:MAG TPA: helix-turn-helix domain-containing protein [Bryobacteraceae bacterium]|jgi:DNA-binding transcriptional ArsR family regulator|nr:helix-turn-helix domain-containing protein [Bryobacteraceae bacterium]